jgi:hypothetical protein
MVDHCPDIPLLSFNACNTYNTTFFNLLRVPGVGTQSYRFRQIKIFVGTTAISHYDFTFF